MAGVRVHAARADAQRLAAVRVYAAAAAVDEQSAVRVYSASAAAADQAEVRVYRVAATVTGAVVAGPDQVDVEPYATVTLAASGGTWTQMSGPTVTLQGSGETVTFRAPGRTVPTTLRFQASDGSTADTTDVTVLPASEYVRVSGEWVGRQLHTRSGGAWV